MQDELAASHTPTAVETESGSAAPGNALLLPYEESCKKVRELALRQLNRMMSYEAKVLKGDDADAIHDMRVASRRLQQVLDLLYPQPRPPELRRLRRQIRRCRQVLGDVRNCDVLLAHVGQSLGRKRSARRDAWTAVQRFLLIRRSESFLRAMHKLGKINLAVLYVNLKEFIHHEKAHDRSAVHPHHDRETPHPAFANDLTSALESAWGRFEDQVAESHRHARPEVIHGARIAAKRLRYLLEVFHEFGVAGSAEVLVWLRQLQQHLGDWHDLEVLEQMMIEMVARPEFLRDQLPLAMEVEKLILRNRQNKVGFEEKYSRMSRGSAEMHHLKEWVAYLLASPSAAFAKV
ncbi:MAG: CHAD domain-containing protein [Terriglobia bacterium]